MRTRARSLAGCAAFLALCLSVSAEFQWAPMDPEFTGASKNAPPMGMRYCPYDSSIKFDRLPKGVSKEAKFGRVNLDKDTTLSFAAYSSEKGPPPAGMVPDTIIFDVNGDKDLTNDETFEGFKPGEAKTVTLKLPNSREVPARIMLDSSTARIQPLEWLKGSVEVSGRRIAAALVDSDGNGLDLSGPGDMLLLDLNGNGRFDVDFSSYNIEEMRYLQDPLLLDGKLYAVKIEEKKPDLTLTDYTGAQGKLALDMRFSEKPDQFVFVAYTTTPDKKMRMDQASSAELPMPLPVGEVGLAMGTLILTGKSGQRTLVEFAVERPMKIEKGQTATLALNKPEPMIVSVEQKADQLTVGQTLKDKEGLKYRSIYALPKEPPAEPTQPDGPGLAIFDAEKKPLFQGNLKYG